MQMRAAESWSEVDNALALPARNYICPAAASWQPVETQHCAPHSMPRLTRVLLPIAESIRLMSVQTGGRIKQTTHHLVVPLF